MKKTLGLAIPVTINYIPKLEDLLKNISLQTEVPDEISISISEIKTYYPSNDYGLNLIITCHEGKKNGASNRNIASNKLSTDLVSFFDCDDLMHPKRIELIKKSFENENISALVHDFEISEVADFKFKSLGLEEFLNQQIDEINLFVNEINFIDSNHLCPVDKDLNFFYHNAHVTVLKKISDEFIYDETHNFPDSFFNRTLVLNGIPISFLSHKLSYYNL